MKPSIVKILVYMIFLAIALGFLSEIYPFLNFLKWIAVILILIVTVIFLIIRYKALKLIRERLKTIFIKKD